MNIIDSIKVRAIGRKLGLPEEERIALAYVHSYTKGGTQQLPRVSIDQMYGSLTRFEGQNGLLGGEFKTVRRLFEDPNFQLEIILDPKI